MFKRYINSKIRWDFILINSDDNWNKPRWIGLSYNKSNEFDWVQVHDFSQNYPSNETLQFKISNFDLSKIPITNYKNIVNNMEGWFTWNKIIPLLELINTNQEKGNILEIGIHHGKSFIPMTFFF